MDKNLSFEHNGQIARIVFFNQKNMSVDINYVDKNDKFIKKGNVVFAQLPKKLKSILNPKR